MREDFFSLLKRDNGIWYYYVYDDFGRRIYRSTGEKIKKYAMEEALRRARTGTLTGAKGRTQFRTFASYAEGFWEYDTCPIVQDRIARGGRYSRQHAKGYLSITERILIPDFGKKYLKELTTSMIQKWLIQCKKRHQKDDGTTLSNKTVNDYLLCLRLILEQARFDGEIKNNPAAEVRPLANDSKPHASFTPDQIHEMFKDRWDNYPCYVACLLSAKTGMRQGEVRALTWEQINPQDCCIEVNASWNDKEGRKTTKAGYSRIVPIERSMLSMLKACAPMREGLIFTTNGRTPCSPNYFNEELDRRMEACSIPKKDKDGLKRSFHSFRYFFNSRLVVANMTGEKIRSVIGHESEEMTDHYTRLSHSDLSFVREIQSRIG